MKKIYLAEAIEVYGMEIDSTRKMYTDHYNKACYALRRGDFSNYRKSMDQAANMNMKLMKLGKELNVIKAAYAAI